jgi:NTE family protein
VRLRTLTAVRGVAALAVTFLLIGAAGAASAQTASGRPTVGVAFGGGSARGIAHIGVIRWFEEHRIPIDLAAGTSMGGLVGGGYATGMSADELRALIAGTDWDMMFGSSSFPFKNLRRKEDARSYPSRLEFGLKGGFVPPTSLNDGQQVDLLLERIAAPYYAIAGFDDLPTPFRVVSVDLKTSEKVVLDRGPLATALRATMSLPGVFPPVERDGRVLVDGGALDNVPADVVRASGAGFVVAIDVGLPPADKIDYSMFGLLGRTIDAMMRASTRQALKDADLTIAVDVTGFGSLDWRRSDELIARGYAAAERNKDALLKYQLSEADWQAWTAARTARRRTTLPPPAFLKLAGVEAGDSVVVQRTLAHHLNRDVDIPLLEKDLATLTGLDRYQSVTWQLTEDNGQTGLLVTAHPKTYAPPFLMLGLNVENTTSESFRVQLAARYLGFDLLGAGSELRVDAGIGADPNLSASLYKALFGSPVFVRAEGFVGRQAFNFVQDDVTVAEYRETRQTVAGDLGVNLSRQSELSGGFSVGHVSDTVRAGDPGLPELSGAETGAHLRWLYDSQDSPVIPSRGLRVVWGFDHTFMSPETPDSSRTNNNLTQTELVGSWFTSAGRRNRFFVVLSGGTSFNDHPLPTKQFTVGYPYILDAFSIGERRGDHYGVLTFGAMRQVSRLPDFLGGPVFIGGWLENGSVFNSDKDADFNTHLAVGLVMDTLIGPVLVATSTGLDGGWRTIFGVGRIFR